MATAPLVRRQNAAFAAGHSSESVEEAELPLEAATGDALKVAGVATAPPPEVWLDEPVRFVVDDITIESLAVRLKAARGDNAARWVKVYGAGTIDVDRKTKNQWTHVERANVSIAGALQPGVMQEILSRRHFELGLVARLLLAHRLVVLVGLDAEPVRGVVGPLGGVARCRDPEWTRKLILKSVPLGQRNHPVSRAAASETGAPGRAPYSGTGIRERGPKCSD
jgi:hypothetical protein